MLGLTGSGKSTYSKSLADKLGVERFAFDIEYAKLGGNLRDHRWDEDVAAKAYDLMKSWMIERLNQNKSVVLDYCPWLKEDRAAFLKLIDSLGAKSHVFYFDVDPEELWRRLSKRNETPGYSQYVTREMLDDFMKRFDAPVGEDVEVVHS